MAYPQPHFEPIAIVGSSCRFAGGVTSPHKLWQLLSNPTNLSLPVPPGRFSVEGFFHSDAEYHGTTNSPKAYWLDQDHRAFDADFFNITPKEAEAIDPQQRLLLEVTYEALESAGYPLKRYAGQNVAVYAGVMTGDYDTLTSRDDLNTSQYAATGNARSIISNRLSYFFDFHGPSMTIDTACSASLVALHQAVQSLRSGECPMACVAGVNMIFTPEQFIVESNLHMLSPTGHCRMWDAKADGYARGEGVVALFVKTLSRALADGDNIQAIIRETGVNSDGRTRGITMPNPAAQTALIQETYARSGLDLTNAEHRPQFFEAHGTGTPVGDPLEARAISEAFFGNDSDSSDTDTSPELSDCNLLVGSVKTVIGHTEGAAGLAGVLKVVQALNHGQVFPNLHLDSVNPNILPFCKHLQIATNMTSWPSPASGQPRRASVNSFGFGGTNAHAIIEQYQPDIHNVSAQLFKAALTTPIKPAPTKTVFPPLHTNSTITLPLFISAASQKSLLYTLMQCKSMLSDQAHFSYQEVCWHQYHNRTAHLVRVAVLADGRRQALDTIDGMIQNAQKSPHTPSPTGIHCKQVPNGPRILGIFTGQGAQYAQMSIGLVHISSVYRDTIESLDDILQNCPDPPSWSVKDQLFASKERSMMGSAEVSQPLCTALQIALVDFLKSIGLSFHCVVGHSSGEIAAAYAAGRISQRDAMLTAYYRGLYAHLVSGTDGEKGGMLACGLSKQQADEFCSGSEYRNKLVVAAINSPSLVTLSGDLDALTSALRDLKQQGIFARQLSVDKAYHSFHMLRAADAYAKSLSDCGIEPFGKGNGTQWVSSVYGTLDWDGTHSAGFTAQYWRDNMTQPVVFQEALELALSQCGTFDCAIEVGPHPALRSPVNEIMKKALGTVLPYASVLNRTKEDHMAVAELFGVMWTNFGQSPVDISSYIEGSPQPQLLEFRLPHTSFSYPWDHSQIHWRESRLSEQHHFRKQPPHELLGVRTRDDNHHQLRWRNILKLEKLPWARGHEFQGQALLPASAYVVMAVDAAMVLLAGRRAAIVELQDLVFLTGIAFEDNSLGIETLFTLSLLSSDKMTNEQTGTIQAEFTFESVPVSSFSFGPMRKNFQGKMQIILPDAGSLQTLPPRRPGHRAETLPVNVEDFYGMMDGIGLSYTGPFKALKSIDRRLNYATATLYNRHPEDDTNLLISPATLDSCFQVAFATFSSPGDKALWTSFLPTKISRIRFDMMNGGFDEQHGETSVESHLTSITPCSRTSATTMTADLSIFDEAGNTRIQVENLVISTIGATKREDDYELYLHTVMDLDPEDAILTANWTDPNGSLAENCDQVAQHNINQFRHTPVVDTPPASPITSEMSHEDFSESHVVVLHQPEATSDLYKPANTSSNLGPLDLIRNADRMPHGAAPNNVPNAFEETQSLLDFRKHLQRVIRQIVHRFPRMNILGLTDPRYDLTESILDGLEHSYLSYTIGNDMEGNLLERLPSLRDNKKISATLLSLNPYVEDADASPGLYDMVIVSASALDNNGCDQLSALKTIRGFTKSGGYLIVISTPVEPVGKRTKTGVMSKAALDSPLTKPNWRDWLNASDECHFISRARNSDQHHSLGFSLSIRQADFGFKHDRVKPAVTMVTEHVLVVGGQTESVLAISDGLIGLLEPSCQKISTAQSLGDVRPDIACSCTGAIILADLEEPVCLSLTAERLEILKHLMRPGMTVLWVTSNARDNPCKATSFGLTRSLMAEIPTLVLQVLDLDKQEDCSNIVLDTFYRLAQHAQSSLSIDSGNVLSVYEHEIHIEGGKRLIPRVLPYKPANDRLNAYRRPVSRKLSILNTCILLEPTRTVDGPILYEARDVGDARSWYAVSPATRLIRVEYSSSQPASIGVFRNLYVCIGRSIEKPGILCVALSPYLASIVQAHVLLTYELSTPNDDFPRLVCVLSQVLFAYELVQKTEQDLVLIEPSQTLRLCIEDLLSSAFSGKNLNLEVWSCNENVYNKNSRTKMVHPWSTAREVRSCLPKTRCLVYDFLPRGVQLSETVAALSTDVDYYRHSSIQPIGKLVRELDVVPSKMMKEAWDSALKLAIAEMGKQDGRNAAINIVTPAQLLSTATPLSQFAVIDWQADRNLQVIVSPLVKSGMLRKDRTYVLVGLTRDLGQSICRLFIEHGAKHIVVASRNPDTCPAWVSDLNSAGSNIHVHRLDVTDLEDVRQLEGKISSHRSGMPRVGGVVNGAMVLDDRVFAHMDIDTWTRVMEPKTIGSKNLDTVFASPDLEFFIMTSSFAAIGGHAGQSNYAAANMYMNGLALSRRNRGLAGSVLNIGVIYGIGLLARERQAIYEGLERDGYPPISERDLHHMFIEAIEAGRPFPGQIVDLTTGLARYHVNGHKSLHWHRDPRFCHFTVADDDEQDGAGPPGDQQQKNIKDLIQAADSVSAATIILQTAFCSRLETVLNLPANSVSADRSIVDIGVDSLVAVDIRDWVYKSSGEDIPVMKILGASSIAALCHEVVEKAKK